MTRFGPHLRDRWLLDPSLTYLNHGTVGATPISILDAQQRVRERIERQPARTLFRELFETIPPQASGERPLLRAAADAVGDFLGARGDDLVFVDNATAAVNTILQTFPFEADDTIALTSLGYGSFPGVASRVAQHQQLKVHTIELPFPVLDPQRIVEAFERGLPHDARMVILDHIASSTALRLPVEQLVAVCRARGAVVVVDGAHAPGNIHLDIEAIGADFYLANLHKWMWTPRSSGILWVRPELQSTIRPLVMSWGLGQGFHAEFDLVGTRDPSPHLTAPAAIAHMQEIGFADIVAYNHQLAVEAGALLADAWGTAPLMSAGVMGSMVCAQLPPRLGITPQTMVAFRDRLLDEHQIEVHVAANDELAWVRVAAQIYCDLSDVQRLADVVNAIG